MRSPAESSHCSVYLTALLQEMNYHLLNAPYFLRSDSHHPGLQSGLPPASLALLPAMQSNTLLPAGEEILQAKVLVS